MPESVATTDVSIAVVTLVDPLKDAPVKPVPRVKVPVVLAVIVVEPPKLTVLPLMVMELLVNEELPMLLSVFDEPLIVLLVRVSAPAKVAKVPVVGKVTLVAPVVVRVKENAPEVVKDPAVVTFPPKVVVNVPLLTPVPPLAGFKIPPKTIPPEVGVPGVNPVVPALNVVTPDPETIAPHPERV